MWNDILKLFGILIWRQIETTLDKSYTTWNETLYDKKKTKFDMNQQSESKLNQNWNWIDFCLWNKLNFELMNKTFKG